MVNSRRLAHSIIELLVVIGLFSLLFGLLLPAVQKARDAAQRISCANNLKQIGLACQLYHDSAGRLPPGIERPGFGNPYPYLGWQAHLLPFIEQDGLWQETASAFKSDPFPFDNPPHRGLGTPIGVFGCPSDGRVDLPQSYGGRTVALTSYLGNEGTDTRQRTGVLFIDSRIRFVTIKDGLSNTLLAGERPPAPDFRFGWWYTGVGQDSAGSLDTVLGAREINLLAGIGAFGGPYGSCPKGPYSFRPGSANNPCDVFHFWSFHNGGANFVMADGSVHFLTYSADSVLPALATRAGGEVVSVP